MFNREFVCNSYNYINKRLLRYNLAALATALKKTKLFNYNSKLSVDGSHTGALLLPRRGRLGGQVLRTGPVLLLVFLILFSFHCACRVSFE